MIYNRIFALMLLSLIPACAGAQDQTPAPTGGALTLPSGQSVTAVDAIEDGDVLRLRYLAPQIASEIDSEAALQDIDWLCANVGLPRAGDSAQVVISLMDRVVPFGETDPEATQYFEAFNVESGSCEIEVFEDD